MLTIHQALGLAVQQHQAGNLPQAEQIYRAILQADPGQVEALHLLGVLAYQRGQHEQAIAYLREVLHRKPDYAEAHNNLGNVLHAQGKLEEARACYQRALRLQPNSAEAHLNLGVALKEQGQLAEAAARLQQALRLRPDYVKAHNNLGNILKEQGKLEEAAASLQQALRLQPGYAEAHLNLGCVLREQGKFAEAAASLQQAVRHRPDFAEAHNNLGSILQAQGKLAEAVASWQQALRYKPDFAEAHHNLARTYKDQGKLEEAALAYQQALRHKPWASLLIESATLLPPIYASLEDLHTWRRRLVDNLAQLHHDQVAVDLTHEPAHPLFHLAYQGCNDRDIQRQLARLYVAPADTAGRRATACRSGERRVKVGFASRHLRDHTIGELFRGTLAQLDRQAFAVTVFSLGHHADATTQFLQEHVEMYVELPENLTVARQGIAAAALDVLVYPDIGMEELTYSLAFSRLAPVQCALWGHPLTTGIPAIDYFLSSEHLDSATAQEHYTEALVRLPVLPVYYYRPLPPKPLPGRAAFGLPERAHLYGCPQSLFKLHPEFDPLLAEILGRDPQGLLVLLEGKYPCWAETLRRRFATTLGAAAQRVVFLDRLTSTAFLNLNAVLDVLLDPLHFGGGKTSYEGLALGVPIVTLPSAYLRGRITGALYQQMQVLDCVAADAEAYIRLAVRLGTEPDYRDHIRAKIQEASAVLYENAAGVRALEAFLLHAVQQA